jgi:UDP-GlcNAc:undecaprenyl-phosphate/decaprenyl-phosphate GlcNAc-1-phosphate transferase
MPYSLLLALAACVVTLALTPLVRALSRRIGALDHPGPRRIHRDPVPTMGGLAFVVATLGVAWAARALPGPAAGLDARPLIGLTLAAIPMLALGVTDDRRGVGPWTKLTVQACAAMVLVHFGYGVPLLTNPFGPTIQSGAWSAPLAVAWVLLVVNAVNLVDGLDGLASGVVLIASATLWWVGRLHADFYVMFLSSLLIGSTLGFLRWNFPPARIFMGDTGSQFLGLTLAAAALLENRKETATATLLLPLVAMGLPIGDSLLAFARRLGSRRHVFHADREHVHHRLLALGLSPRGALFVLWTVCALFGAVAVVLSLQPRSLELMVLLALALALFVVLEIVTAAARARAARRGPGAGRG